MSITKQITGRSTTVEDVLQRDSKFRYMLLSRLQCDCEYYLNYGNRFPGCLWAGNEQKQIEYMTKLHESFKDNEKPEWLTMEKIKEYARRMLTPDVTASISEVEAQPEEWIVP